MRIGFASILFVIATLSCHSACAQDPIAAPFTPDLLTKQQAWMKGGDGVAASGRNGIELWVKNSYSAMVSQPVMLPKGANAISLNIHLAGGARLIVQLLADYDGSGTERSYSPAWGADIPGQYSRPLDPRVFRPDFNRPVRISVAIDGPVGASAILSGLNFISSAPAALSAQAGQKRMLAVESMPPMPSPYRYVDWKQRCRNYVNLAFNPKAIGPDLPLSRISADAGETYFAQCSYVGDDRVKSGAGESITGMFGVISGAVSGIDMRNYRDVDWVSRCDAWFCKQNGLNLLTDYRNGPTPENYWYDLQPSVAYAWLLDLYPGRRGAEETWRKSIETLARVHDSLKAPDGVPDYNFSGFDYKRWKPAEKGSKEPDNFGLAAWLFYLAYRHSGGDAYLNRALECFKFWDRQKEMPFIETGAPFGAVTAVRINAEMGMHLPLDRYMQSVFDFHLQGHTGIGIDRWGESDICGLWHDPAAKAYLFESAQLSVLVPVARYAPEYSAAIGKWFLNLTNSMRYFYPDQLPAESQTCSTWFSDPAHAIPYERINWGRKGKWLFACSDAMDYHWPVKDLSLYSGASVGLVAGRCAATDVPEILNIDLNALDPFKLPAWPAILLYNPYPSPKTVTIDVGAKRVDLYDVAHKRYALHGAVGKCKVRIEACCAVNLVAIPAGEALSKKDGHLMSAGRIVDYAP